MMTFKERLGKPSAAVQAMIDGLREIEKTENMLIDMDFYASRSEETGKCFVCAATAAALKATDTPPEKLCDAAESTDFTTMSWEFVSGVMGMDCRDTMEFENRMDMFRRGLPGGLLRYFEVPAGSPAYNEKHMWHVRDDWKSSLGEVEEYRDKLIELGL